MSSKRKLVRDMWKKNRTKVFNLKGETIYDPSWEDFKQKYIKENPSKKKENK